MKRLDVGSHLFPKPMEANRAILMDMEVAQMLARKPVSVSGEDLPIANDRPYTMAKIGF